MPKSLNRRELLTAAAIVAAGAAAINVPAMAQADALLEPQSPKAAALPNATEEGTALISAAYAAAGFPLPPDQMAEVRKQLFGYPGDFAKARAFTLDNGNAPTADVTPALPTPAPKRRSLLDGLGIH